MASAERDQLLRRVRAARWTLGLGAAGLTAAFSVAAAHAFKGHDGHATARQAPATTTTTQPGVSVPGPDSVPEIADDGSLQPPEEAPQQAAPQQRQPPQQQQPQQQQAQPPVSGGS